MNAGLPQDHLSKRLTEAIAQQAANLAQKAIIDNVVVKFTRILAIVHGEIMRTEANHSKMTKAQLLEIVERQGNVIVDIQDTLKLTRDEVAAIRLQPEHSFPDERVQEILTRAVDEITAAILDDGGMRSADDPNHNRNHKRVKRHFGSASEYKCACGKQSEDWSQTHDTDGSSDDHFTPRCRKCHADYDYDLKWGAEATARRSKSLIGKGGGPRSEEAKARMRLAHQNCRCPRHQKGKNANA